ncbi:hypothetical protein ROG8370_01939 [Roseovarius gaetbuli]|uniref:Peptidase S74 domain-containing protein n=1 Tax=Roseovarius gaetbuli TaxID=1356575 RepID=A0A1X6Z9P1_9RHOB|nr:tail fiber domain-containing protein [Roseovarius gaetbuli]SLN45373.1 hypothetical protein ROG8370_01939 [Roseovarius gaetbuli]
MKKLLISTFFASTLVLTGMAQAAEKARVSAKQVRSAATVSSQGSVGSAGPEVVVLIIMAIVFITALVFSGGSSAGTYPAMMSDERLKTDIKRVGTSPDGFGIYQFRYKGHAELIQGAMAQDVQRLRPGAVSRHRSGFLMVDYGQIDVAPRLID